MSACFPTETNTSISLNDMFKNYLLLLDNIDILRNEIRKLTSSFLDEHSDQVNENKKISIRVDELQEKIKELENFKHVRFRKYHNKPFKCPVCNGKRLDLTNPIPGTGGLKWDICLVCKGQGIVWG